MDAYTIPPGRNGCPSSDELRRDAPKVNDRLPPFFEDAIVRVLLLAPRSGETQIESCVCKENALGFIFEHLSVVQSRALLKRLVADRDDDRVAVAFRRFVPERKQRLCSFLFNAPRRAALAHNP